MSDCGIKEVSVYVRVYHVVGTLLSGLLVGRWWVVWFLDFCLFSSLWLSVFCWKECYHFIKYFCQTLFCVSATGLCSIIFFIICILGIVLLFLYYALENCTTNRIFLGVNTALCVILSFITIFPCIEKRESCAETDLFACFPSCILFFFSFVCLFFLVIFTQVSFVVCGSNKREYYVNIVIQLWTLLFFPHRSM